MATATSTMEIDTLAASVEILIKTELLIFLSDGNLMASPINPPPETPPIPIRISELPNNLSTRIFVFKDPKALEEYFHSESHLRATHLRLVPMHRFIDAPFPRVSLGGCSSGWTRRSPNKPPEVCEFYKAMPFPFPSLEFVSIDHITYPEGEEFITLIADWRAACRAVPKKHKVQEITFDLDGSMKLHSSYVTRVVQMVSTVFAVKAEGPFHSRLRDDEPYPGKDLVSRGLARNVRVIDDPAHCVS
ncbi:hypothetical protein N7491_003189 [Penicillium cf. griseofulvum]|uniref:Uncharacterized protein n=1 Tax=Penicillium cf. griseofulvum TaxID=2972120 RepID=A0A9W9MRH6_9EURO|nr:hypothetical protein N7472_002639 [Penicillium cf. griseofulvum]KAJ5440783.1 hypothetical protein N7491_003189 [Penicillium cf. griseofulvum]KAJ5448829.1 hypothetical protein N7445_003650 [Penicillium cf. griseofulvum]